MSPHWCPQTGTGSLSSQREVNSILDDSQKVTIFTTLTVVTDSGRNRPDSLQTQRESLRRNRVFADSK